MNARNQLLAVLTALMLVCSSGAMVVGAAPTTVDEHTQVDDDETDVPEEGNDTSTAEDTTDSVAEESNDSDAEEPTGEENQSEELIDEEVDGEQDAYVNFSDQATEGETVVIDNVTMASGGFVVIHDSSLLAGGENVFSSVIGTSAYLEAGTHENVEVTFDEPLTEDETLIAMPHRDTNANETYDFVETEGAADAPYLTAEDDPVTDQAVVTVGEPAAEEPNETEEPVDEVPVEEPNETEEPVDEVPVEEPNETEEPVDEEPVEVPNETEEPVEEEEPVEVPNETEEPVIEEPNETDDGRISVHIENVTVFVFLGDHPDMPAANESYSGCNTDGISVENGTDTANETDTSTETGAATEGTFEMGEQQIDVTLGQVTVVPVSQHQSGMSDHHAGTGESVHEQSNETESPIEAQPGAADNGNADIVIEQATVFVFIGDTGELPEQPVEEPNETEEPIVEEPNETEEPVEDEETGETIIEESNETEEPVVEEPNETEEPVVEEPNETEEPVVEEPNETEEPVVEEPNETEEPVVEEPNETEEPVVEEPNETEEPIVEEPNETEEPVEDEETGETIIEESNETEEPVEEPNETEEPVEDEETADSFTVENLQAPATAEAGEPLTVTATVTNPTDEERTEAVQFRLDGDLVEAQETTLAAGETTDVEFEVDTSDIEPGQYVHMVLTDFSGEVSAIEITAATSGDSDLESEGDLENDTTVDGETNVTVNESTNATAGITAAN
ncbi:hypothetical protein Htur_5172 (plasmid) [Haloterrigena turkmenica DSM 5511]|uniref:DUF7282 domain-containing protein n=1 Tax=Haloterrigena turkmenica (strain ATCC 51198 / DSM 5511 / JCM 9101 / NCIMB 13204 / VKM B-1734 / 4k) TaxID=543526 RepID=D2S356_HALTV|nr:hypothetical protein [Haloterrigena turkmenica]ADB63803.1 hypothetical protein Htur_5172 [Haloterrigena turkmenica DSM 5511]